MKYFFILIVLFLFSVDCNAQSIRKVSGVSNISLGYSRLKYGNDLRVQYSNFFAKGYYYYFRASAEKSKVTLTTYSSCHGGLGIGRCIILPIKNLYLNANLGVNAGNLNIANEYFSDKNQFIYNLYLEPGLEFFFSKRFSVTLGTSIFKDFGCDFRGYHYSYNASLTMIY